MMSDIAPPAFFTICARNRLAFARALCASVREHHPGARFYVALCDLVDGAMEIDAAPFEIITLDALAIPGFDGMAGRYGAAELNAAIKPFVFEHLFAVRDEQRIVYLAPDTQVYSPLRDVVDRLGVDIDAILTPHVLAPAENAGIDDIRLLQLGVFNLGFVALHRTERVRAIVQWWGRRLQQQCVVDVRNGLFLDQKWANLLPSFIARTLILHHPGYNVACWNLWQRGLARGERGWTVNGQPLVFFHFNASDFDREDALPHRDSSSATAMTGAAAELLHGYSATLLAHGHAQDARLPTAFVRGDARDLDDLILAPVPALAPVPELADPDTPDGPVTPPPPLRPSAAVRAAPRGRLGNALVTLGRAREHAGGWWPLAAKGVGVYRRGGLRLMRDTVRQLNRTHPHRQQASFVPAALDAHAGFVQVAQPLVHAQPHHAPPPADAVPASALDALRAQMEAQCEARLHAARAEVAAQWSQRVVAARVETAAQLSRQVSAVHAQVAAHWSSQLAAADAARWPLPAVSASASSIAPSTVSVPSPRERVLIMSHDAQAHGAQYLALSLLREFLHIGVEVEVLMQGPGWLEPQFTALAPMHRLYRMDADALRALAADLHARGFTRVIANTTVTGCVIWPFRDAGMRIVSLIHELPQLIASYGLETAREVLADASERLVVPARPIRDGLVAALGEARLEGKLVTRTQGLYTRNRYRGSSDMREPRARLRSRLGLPEDARIALSVGYADLRKGADLLAEATVLACAARPDFHTVWVGHADAELRAAIEAKMAEAGLADRFRFVGLDFDTDDYFAGADVYALTSREDPFPSVVMESLVVGVPVVAFAGTGGCADLVDGLCGFSVPAFDVGAYADAMLRIIDDAALGERLGDAGRSLIDREFGFRRYALDLLDMVGIGIAQVSAVVPNYNYARYLPERIDSIAAQAAPMTEIVVLDDASSDNSIEVLRLQRMYTHPEPVIVHNAANSGSVFRQWLAGVRRARGEFVWIAEADDAADPGLVQALLPAMRADPGIVMAYAQSSRVDAAGFVLHADYLGYTDDLSPARWRSSYTATGAEEVEAGLAVKNTIPNVSAVLFRREALLEVLETHIDELAEYRIAGDWLAYLHLLREGRIHYVPEVLNRHRYHGGSVTGALQAQRHYDEVVSVQALAQRLYPVGASTRAAASDYARSLRAHFGLD
jgi:glycosyltransferase involved in cell wall biosynthesis